MNTWQNTHFSQALEKFGKQAAVIDSEQRPVTYTELAQAADRMADQFGPQHSLVLIRSGYNLHTVSAYLACLRHQRVALLIDEQLPQAYFQELIRTYQPEVMVDIDGSISSFPARARAVRKDLALLLTTSGTTGSPKMVMLSNDNLQANAKAICNFLPIDFKERTITTLPFHYSYGLSVLNSHLMVGASTSITGESILNRAFWDRFKHEKITSFAGVPFVYEMLKRLRFEQMDLPFLKYFTQAGGRLPTKSVIEFGQVADKWNIPFFVMYGQTEATARMTYVPPGKILDNPDSIGIPIPGGKIYLRSSKDGSWVKESGQEGELVYQGDNVMLGYADKREDLYGEEVVEELSTGDIGRINENGLFEITGRLKRFVKLYGQRVNLDEVEQLMSEDGHEVLCGGTDQNLIVGCLDSTPESAIKQWVSDRLHIHPGIVRVLQLPERPLTRSGKTDYRVLLEC